MKNDPTHPPSLAELRDWSRSLGRPRSSRIQDVLKSLEFKPLEREPTEAEVAEFKKLLETNLDIRGPLMEHLKYREMVDGAFERTIYSCDPKDI